MIIDITKKIGETYNSLRINEDTNNKIEITINAINIILIH